MKTVYPPNSQSQYTTSQQTASRALGRWVIYLLVLGLVGVLIYWFFASRDTDFEVSLISKEGAVEYRENEREGWKETGGVPFQIREGFEIRTLEGGKAVVSLADGSEMRLDSFSRMVLIEKNGRIKWVQTDGNSHHQLVKDENRKEYIVAFSEGEVKALGTAFEVKIGDTDTEVLVLSNEVELKYKDDTSEKLQSGNKLMVTPMGKKTSELEEGDLRDDWTLGNMKEDQERNFIIDKNVLWKAGLEEKKEEEKKEEEKKEENSDSSSETGSSSSPELVLEAKKSDKGILLTWRGGEDKNGWRVVRSENDQPTYPDSTYRSVGKGINSYLWEKDEGGKRYFRVCSFEEGKGCVQYSQSVDMELDKKVADSSEEEKKEEDNTTKSACENSGGTWNEEKKTCTCPSTKQLSGSKCIDKPTENFAKSVSLTAKDSGKKAKLNWNIKGGDAPYGYKVLRGTGPNPRYPDSRNRNISSEETKKYTWDELKRGTTYYFRICVYDNQGKCAKYSNDVKVKIPKKD